MTFTIAIIGRPNVGKSTLFNRLVGKRLAIVDDTPGVTRDRREGEGNISDISFRLFDTAGLEDVIDDSIESRMREQTERAVGDADVALLLIDGRAGVTPTDEHFANWLRRQKIPVIVGVNKCEGHQGESGRLEAYAFGLGEPIALSAEHGQGLDGLYDALLPYHEAAQARIDANRDEEDIFEDRGEEEDDEVVAARPMQLAIVGRPNVGKSTLVNQLLGSDRMLTGPEAGITRDAIATPWSWDGRDIKLVDTAGLRRRARVHEKLEHLSVNDTFRAIQYAQIVVLVVDADQPLEKQDLTIARRVVDEGRGLLIAINKWDAVKDRKGTLELVQDRLHSSLPQIRGVKIVTMSAKTGKGVDRLLPTVFEVFDTWNARVPTGALNRWLSGMLEAHPPPLGSHGKRLTIRYATQIKSRPPTFALFSSTAGKLSDSYLRYLINGLRDDFGLDGVPIRMITRSGKNPFI